MAEDTGDKPTAQNSAEKGAAAPQEQQQQAPTQGNDTNNPQAANSSQQQQDGAQQQQQGGSQQQQEGGAQQQKQDGPQAQQQQQQGIVPKPPRKAWAGPRISMPPPIADPSDGRILLLFDLNGVLTEKTPPRVEGKFIKRDHIVRPHIAELLRLYPHFLIGVFSSATIRTVNTALDTLYAALQRSTSHTGIEGLLLPKKFDLFSVICYRDHCQPDPYWKSREDGKDHDTIKPLARMGFNLTRTVLVDNDDYKAADGEHENMLHVPHWEQTEETNRDFPLMIQLILRHLRGVTGDVRPHLRLIEQQLKQLRSTDPSRIAKATDRAKARALTAATGQAWAGDEELRAALAAEEVSAPTAAAAAAAAAAAFAAAAGLEGEGGAALGLRSPQMQQKMRLFALQGMKVWSAAELDACPPEARKLVQLLSRHTSAAAAAAGTDAAAAGAEAAAAGAAAAAATAAAATAATDAHQLLVDAGDSLAASAYDQHSLLLLLLCVWGCNLTLPESAFTLSQLTDLLKSRGWPTKYVTAVLEIMLRVGTLKVADTMQQQQQEAPQQQQQQVPQQQAPQQQQQQQQRWMWPDDAGTWPTSEVPLPPAVAGAATGSNQQQQQQPQELPWADCLLRLPEPRVKQLMKSVEDVTSFLATASPAAVAEVLRALEDICKQQLGIKVQRPPPVRAQRLPRRSPAKKTAAPKIIPEQIAGAWASMINAAIRDLTAVSGATADQLLRFIQGLAPELQLQLLGPSSREGRQQQVQQLQQQLEELATVVKAIPARIRNKREKSLLGPPFGIFATIPLPPFLPSGKPVPPSKYDAAAATALTRYTVGVVPNAEAVARSIRVLQAGARAQNAEAVAEAIAAAQVEQQQQLDEHVKRQGGAPVHSLLHQLKPPVVAALSLSSHLNLPPLVSQWLLECQRLDDAQQKQRLMLQLKAAAAEDAAAEGAEGAEGAANGGQGGGSAGKRAHGDGDAADAAAAAAAGGGSLQKKPKMTPQQLQQAVAIAAADEDLDALYAAAEEQRQQEAAALAAEEAAAAAELAAVDQAAAEPGLESALDLLLPDADGDENGMDGEDEGEEDDQGSGEGEEDEDQGFEDGGPDDDDDEGGDDDGGFNGGHAAAAAGGGGGGDWDMDQDGSQQQGDGGNGEGHGDGDNAGGDGGSGGDAAMSDGPAGEDDGESLYDDDSSQDDADDGEFGYQLDSEDDSEAWATDDEADGQLQLGITGLGGDDDSAAAAAGQGGDGSDAAADAAAEASTATQRAAAAAVAAGAGAQVRGRSPLYQKLLAALNKAREGDAAAGGSNGSNGGNIVQKLQLEHLLRQPSRLHHELLHFAAAAAPSAVERLVVESAMQQLQQAADKAWPAHGPEALLFGSQATGLALPGSDLDVVLLAVPGCPGTRKTDKGFSIDGRRRVTELLWKFAACLKAARGQKKAMQVINAKVPILKGTLLIDVEQQALLSALALDNKAAAQSMAAASVHKAARLGDVLRVEMQVDISIGIADSQAAVHYLQRQVRTLPPLRPLMLAAKAITREAGLNEVFTGGLGSYTLALMVISHLQAEGVADAASSAMSPDDHSPSANHQANIAQHLQHTAAAAAAAAAATGAGAVHNIHSAQGDLGLLLHGFFLRFGALFNYTTEAVAVNQRGVVPKPQQWVQQQRPFLLSVEDPSVPGRDMSSGSYAIRDVKAAFLRTATSLRELTADWEAPTADVRRRSAAAELKHYKLLPQAAAAAAAAVLASSQRTNGTPAAAPAAAAAAAPQQQQAAFQVLEDRQAWASVQADGQSRSFGGDGTPAAAAAAAAAVPAFTSSSPALPKKAAAALLKASQVTLKTTLQQQLAMLGSVMDLHAAVGRGMSADGRRIEQARRASLRGQGRSKGQALQQQQGGVGPGQPHKKQNESKGQQKAERAQIIAWKQQRAARKQEYTAMKQQRALRVQQNRLAGIAGMPETAKEARRRKNARKQQNALKQRMQQKQQQEAKKAAKRAQQQQQFGGRKRPRGGNHGGGGGGACAAAGGGGRGWAHAD